MGFISFVISLILFVWLAGIVGRWLLRRWIARKQREFAERFGDQGGASFRTYRWGGTTGGNTGRNTEREGEVRVAKGTGNAKRVNSNVGEYVDYEECGPDECDNNR